MENIMESHGISKAQKSMNPDKCYQPQLSAAANLLIMPYIIKTYLFIVL